MPTKFPAGSAIASLTMLIISQAAFAANTSEPHFGFQPIEITRTAEGFSAGGKNYIDPNARIEQLCKVSDTGYVTYTILGPTMPGQPAQYLVRMVAPLGDAQPTDLGILEYDRSQWHYTPKGGMRFSADAFLLASRGVLMLRKNTVVTYVSPDVAPRAFVVPDGYAFSRLQKGDVSYSKHLLIQQELPPKTLFGMITVTNNAKDYNVGLFNMETGEVTTTFTMRLRGPSDALTLEHFNNTYFLFNTKNGPLTIELEDGYQRVVARNLATRKTVTLFERSNGIAGFDPKQSADGRIHVVAAVGFSNERVDDVEALFETAATADADKNTVVTE